MSNPAETSERHGRILAELAEIGMAIAREVQAGVLAAETPQARAEAAALFPQIARAVRQSVALEAKLQRDLARQDRADRQDADREVGTLIRRRKAQVRLHMQRAICAASAADHDQAADGPPDEVMARLEDLRDRLDDEVLDADFALRPFHEVIETLHRSLGLPPPTRMADDDDLTDRTDDPDGDPDDDPDPGDAHDPPPPTIAPATDSWQDSA